MIEDREVTMYVTKYALTAGIQRQIGKRTDDGVYFRNRCDFLRIGRDVFDNMANAVADAEKRRIAKIASVRKQLAKLEKLTFSDPTA